MFAPAGLEESLVGDTELVVGAGDRVGVLVNIAPEALPAAVPGSAPSSMGRRLGGFEEHESAERRVQRAVCG